MADTHAFETTFATLRAMLKPYAGRLEVQADQAGLYTLALPDVMDRAGRPLFVAGVRKGKAYVSYHLMAVYAFPRLLNDLSPGLRKRMQGKACFNFTAIDPLHVKELKALTKRSVEGFNTDAVNKMLGR